PLADPVRRHRHQRTLLEPPRPRHHRARQARHPSPPRRRPHPQPHRPRHHRAGDPGPPHPAPRLAGSRSVIDAGQITGLSAAASRPARCLDTRRCGRAGPAPVSSYPDPSVKPGMAARAAGLTTRQYFLKFEIVTSRRLPLATLVVSPEHVEAFKALAHPGRLEVFFTLV